jgi:predicted lipoprotein with Yx(FWY)xxD motif
MRSKSRLMVLGIGLIAVLAACSNSGASSSPAASAAPSAAPSVAASAEASAPAAGTTVALADSSLGKILVDAKGMTLYMFTPDEAGTPTCYADCATNWPALLADGTPTAGTGIDASKLSTVDRTDGGKQVKIGTWPLYTFAADKAAGDTNGQGVGDKWYVVGADGAPIKPAAAAGTTIALADSALGKILVDGKGMTLYMFTPDEDAANPTCNGDCATNWPALIADGTPTAGTGLDATKLATIDRTDGGKQIKFGEYPLYTFAADKAAGDTNGQGVGEKWYVVGADGEPIKGS